MIAPAREAAFKTLTAVTLHRRNSDDVLHSTAVSALSERDRNLVTELLYGSLRWQLLLDHFISSAVRRKMGEVDPRLIVLLRMSVYQLWRMERIPAHAAVNDAVELAKGTAGTGASRFVNAVLRSLARLRPWEDADDVARLPAWVPLSVPKWLWERWRERFGEETARRFCASLNSAPRSAIRVPPPDPPPPGFSASEIVPGAWVADGPGSSDPPRTPGRFRTQDEASQLVACLPPVTPESRVWDACAAPGGKTAVLTERVGGASRVVASDRSLPRARRLTRTLRAWGFEANVAVADARLGPPFKGGFDCVLADVPCSGLGTLRRNPEIRWRLDPRRLAELSALQRSILSAVSAAVRAGGYLLYSTCSTEPEEDELVVDSFLETHRDFRLLEPSQPAGVRDWLDSRGFVRTYPSSRPWDGFFAALMVRES